jgi:hypothetical protein
MYFPTLRKCSIMPTHIYNVCGLYAVSIEFFALGKEKSPH